MRGAFAAVLAPGVILEPLLSETLIDFGHGVRASKPPEWLENYFMYEAHLAGGALRELRNSTLAFSTEFEYEAGSGPGHFDRPAKEELAAAERVRQALVSLWIAQPIDVEVSFSVHGAELDETLQWSRAQVRPARMLIGFGSDDRRGNHVRADRIQLARRIFDGLRSPPALGSFKTAELALWHATNAQVAQVTTLLHWIALEALFGSDTSEKVTQRIVGWLHSFAVHRLGITSLRPRDVYRLYANRSQLVHGRTFATSDVLQRERWLEASTKVEGLLRAALQAIALDTHLRRAFSGPLRERFLIDEFGDVNTADENFPRRFPLSRSGRLRARMQQNGLRRALGRAVRGRSGPVTHPHSV